MTVPPRAGRTFRFASTNGRSAACLHLGPSVHLPVCLTPLGFCDELSSSLQSSRAYTRRTYHNATSRMQPYVIHWYVRLRIFIYTGQLCNKMKQLRDPAEANPLRCPLARLIWGSSSTRMSSRAACVGNRQQGLRYVWRMPRRRSMHAKKRDLGEPGRGLEPWSPG